MVALVFIVYWLLIFEGALRKWVLPHEEQALFFIRDPFVLVAYWLAYRDRLLPPRIWWLVFGLLALSWVPICLQFFFGTFTTPLLAVYGWREYFLYIPFPFIIGTLLDEVELNQLVRHTLLISIPTTALCVLQAHRPASDPINQGLGQGPGSTFSNLSVAFGIVRPQGTFTSSEGQSLFIGSLVLMLTYVWLLKREERPIGTRLLLGASSAAVVSLVVSGSRYAFVLSAIVLLFGVCGGLLAKGIRPTVRRTLPFVLVLVVAGGVAVVAFPTIVEALVARTTGAAASDAWWSFGLANRSASDTTEFIRVLPQTPLLGFGLGTGGNGFTILGGQLPLEAHVEADWSRQLVDLGPPLGLCFILFRTCLALWLCTGAIRATSRSHSPLPLLLFALCGVLIFNGQITGNGTVNGYAWLFSGFCIASCRNPRSGDSKSHSPTASEAGVPALATKGNLSSAHGDSAFRLAESVYKYAPGSNVGN